MNQDYRVLVGITDDQTEMHFTYLLYKKEVDLMDDYCLEGMKPLEAYRKMRDTYPISGEQEINPKKLQMNSNQKMPIGIMKEDIGIHFTYYLTKKEIELTNDYCLEGMSMIDAYNKMRETYPVPEEQKKLNSNIDIIIGAIAGDIIGSIYELSPIKTKDFPLFQGTRSRFTDDTVMTIAVADSIISNKPFKETYIDYARRYPKKRYGTNIHEWILWNAEPPFNSFGNGSAMRVSPIGAYYNTFDEVMDAATKSAEVTHNHPEGIKGAKAIAAAILYAKQGFTKELIKSYIEKDFDYDLNFTLDDIRPAYSLDITCQGSVPQAIKCFLESSDYEDAIRLAISLGGDSDTIACMTGGIAAAYYKAIPAKIIEEVMQRLPHHFLDIISQFNEKVRSRNQKEMVDIGITDEKTGMHMLFSINREEEALLAKYCFEGMEMLDAYVKMRETYPDKYS